VNPGRAIGLVAASVTLSYRAIFGRPLRSYPSGQLLLRIIADQKRIWASPAAIARGQGWPPTLAVLSTTAALIALDPLDSHWLQQPAFQRRPVVLKLNRILSGGNMALLINFVPLGFFVGGLLFRNSFAWQTGVLAAEAAADVEIIATTMKHLDRRKRPIEVGPDGDFRKTWFRTKNRNLDGAGCFPSGHTASAFAVATVLAERYRSRWVAVLAYGMAGVIGASRVTLRAHFPSDVFFGAAAGYSVSHFVVMPRDPGRPETSA
jgi:membrane-associated phospholipid phosphatase